MTHEVGGKLTLYVVGQENVIFVKGHGLLARACMLLLVRHMWCDLKKYYALNNLLHHLKSLHLSTVSSPISD